MASASKPMRTMKDIASLKLPNLNSFASASRSSFHPASAGSAALISAAVRGFVAMRETCDAVAEMQVGLSGELDPSDLTTEYTEHTESYREHSGLHFLT